MTLQPWWQYKRGISRIVLSVPVSGKAFTRQKEMLIDASPSLSFNLQPGRRHKLWSAVGFSQNSGGWAQFALSDYASDYRTRVNTCGAVPRNGTLYATAQYDYKRTLAEFFSSVSISYNRTWRNLMTDMTVSDGRYTLSTVARDNVSSVISAKAVVSKGFFSLRAKAKSGVKMSRAEGSQLSGGAVSRYTSNAVSATPELTFAPSFGTFTYQGTFNINAMKTLNARHRTLTDWEQRLSYTHSIGLLDLSFIAVHYRNELQSGSVSSSFLTDAAAVLRLKRVRLSLSARNLFDKRAYELTAYSGVTVSTTRYNLRPREVIVEAQISI